jgi:hypothetical protein
MQLKFSRYIILLDGGIHNMLEIVTQHVHKRYGNECIINQCYCVLKFNDKYMYVVLTSYNGSWVDDDIHTESFKQFDDKVSAMKFYQSELNKLTKSAKLIKSN